MSLELLWGQFNVRHSLVLACSFLMVERREPSYTVGGNVRLSWSPLSGLKGVQPPLPFGEKN